LGLPVGRPFRWRFGCDAVGRQICTAFDSFFRGNATIPVCLYAHWRRGVISATSVTKWTGRLPMVGCPSGSIFAYGSGVAFGWRFLVCLHSLRRDHRMSLPVTLGLLIARESLRAKNCALIVLAIWSVSRLANNPVHWELHAVTMPRRLWFVWACAGLDMIRRKSATRSCAFAAIGWQSVGAGASSEHTIWQRFVKWRSYSWTVPSVLGLNQSIR